MLKLGAACVAAYLVSAAPAQSTLDHPVGDLVPFHFDTGKLANPSHSPATVALTHVALPGAQWLRVHFSRCDLEGESYISIKSLRDGEIQILDAAAAALWSHSSAFFNGDDLLVELHAAPGTSTNRFAIDTLSAESFSHRGETGQCGICGIDDRSPSANDAVARLMPVGCTATIYCRSSAMLSAGHCAQPGMVAQFRVPPSSGGCSLINPPVADQFPVVGYSFVNGGVGDDYAVLQVGQNNLGQFPFHRYNTLIPLGAVPAPGAPVSFFGNGMDMNCVRNQVQQFSFGSLLTVTPTTITYNADLRGGNSGSSLLSTDSGAIIGIVTHCSVGCPNYATRIDVPAFITARNTLNPACQSTLRLVTFQNSTISAPLSISPPDVNGLSSAAGSFKRVFPNGTNITLAAPQVSGTLCFANWTVNGETLTGNPISFPVAADTVITANFEACYCDADFNHDRLVDFFDYLDFIEAFSDFNSIADFNRDSTLNLFDYLDFVDALSRGC